MKGLTFACLSMIAVTVQSAFAQESANPQTPSAAQPAESGVHVAPIGPSSEPLVSMAFDETPLSDVIKAFRDATGANIISSGTNLQGSVSVRLDNVPWRQGLTSILEPQGLQLVEQPVNSGIFIVSARTEVVPKVTQTFDLKYARSEDVTNLVVSALGKECQAVAYTAANVVIITATEKQIAECEAIIKAIDKQTPQVYIEVRFAELSASASKKLGLKWDNLGGNGWGVGFDGASFGYSDTRGRDRSRVKTSGATASLSDDRSVSENITDSFENDLRNIAGSSGSSSLLGQNSTRNATRSFSDTKSGSQERLFSGSLSMDAFALTLNAFEEIDGVSIFSNPKIIVANEREAVIDMTTKEPNLTMTTSRSGTSNDQLDISARLELIPGNLGDKDGKGKGLFAGEAFFSYGISVKVTPRISPTDLITLVVEPSISALNPDNPYYVFNGVDQNTPTPRFPIINMQRMQTVFSMQSGTTAVIGGLTKTTEGTIDSGIPLLRNLPWIGSRIFGWKSRAKEQKEIIIFVTVGIADPIGLPESIGMPKNAILGRDLLTGALKEPGDRTKEEVLSIDDPKPARKEPIQKPAVMVPDAPARPSAPAPAPVETPVVPVEPPAPAAPAPAPVEPPVVPVEPPAPAETAPVNEAEAAKPDLKPVALEPLLQN